jgi:hypothetical protein
MRDQMTKRIGMFAAMLLLATGGAFAYVNEQVYSGLGLTADGFGGYDLATEVCGTTNGAVVNGPYMLWVLTAPNALAADITGPWGTAEMTRLDNGTFQYVSGWYVPSKLAPGGVVATYTGKLSKSKLVISHGCRPFTAAGAWCSPGFWRNATEGAWALTGHSRSDRFNLTVFDVWYGVTFAANPTLDTVLTTNGGTYKGPAVPGTSGYALNAFNATGAFLTDQVPGYRFDWTVMNGGSSDACPIDHFGNFK